MRKRRRTTSLIVVLALCVGGSLVFVGSAGAIDIEPFVQFIDRGLPKIDEVATGAVEGSTRLPDYFGDAASDRAANRLLYGFDLEEESPTFEEARNDTDWCMWSGLTQSAIQIDDGDTTSDDGTQDSPADILASNLSSCLESHLDTSDDQITALTNKLVFQNEVNLVQSQSGVDHQSAANWLVQNGLTFDPSSWASWFNYAASTIPPAN
jgi:hypothetical protein